MVKRRVIAELRHAPEPVRGRSAAARRVSEKEGGLLHEYILMASRHRRKAPLPQCSHDGSESGEETLECF